MHVKGPGNLFSLIGIFFARGRLTCADYRNGDRLHAGYWITDSRTPRAYPSELTPIGEQLVIPGCERQPVAGNRQMNLFGG